MKKWGGRFPAPLNAKTDGFYQEVYYALKKAFCVMFTLASFAVLPVFPALANEVYRVKPGDSLYSIAKENNVSLEKLLASNPFMEDPFWVVPYQIIILPEDKPGGKYTVVKGDTLKTIADKYGLKEEDVISYNGIAKGSVFPGQIIILPPAAKQSNRPENDDTNSAPQTEYSIPQLLKKHPGLLFLNGSQEKKIVALTFDDGPDDIYTPKILEILDQQDIKATFFLVGSRIKDYPSVVSQLAA